MNASLKLVKLGDIRPNPFRDIGHYPIDRVKVELLRQSYERTGFWQGYMIVRPVEGGYEQAFGHHRVVAAKELWGEEHEIPVTVSGLSDDMMLAMMAHENNERFAQFFYLSVMEPIEAVVKAYAEGRIELEKPSQRVKETFRVAPSFCLSEKAADHSAAYGPSTVARYLGWVKKGEGGIDRANDRVLTALAALELIEKKVLTRQQFLSLTQSQAEGLVRATNATIKVREADAEADAKVHDQAAQRAADSGNKRKAEEHKATAERMRETATEQATKAAKAVAAQVADRLSSGERLTDVLEDTVAAGIKESVRKAKDGGKRLAEALPFTASELESLAAKYDKMASEDERARVAACRSTKAKAELVDSAKRLRERLSLLMKALG